MLNIRRSLVEQVRQASAPADLFGALQSAIELEHATIPPYLAAMISVNPQKNAAIAAVIRSVVVEEMLHMTIACNVLNALGGAPQINNPAFIPSYPGGLPLGVHHGLTIGLEAYSVSVVQDIFMEIEEPESPLNFPGPDGHPAIPPRPDHGHGEDDETIGEFYAAIQQSIRELPGPDTLPGDPARQVVNRMFPERDMFPIYTKSDAVRALAVIVQQGEGATGSPSDLDGELAHYYRFAELIVGRKLIPDPSAAHGFSFTGEAIPFDASAVHPIVANMKVSDLPPGSEVRRLASQFSFNYSKLLNGLHRTFNGDPGFIAATMGLMYDVKIVGAQLVAMPLDATHTAGLPFEFVQTNT